MSSPSVGEDYIKLQKFGDWQPIETAPTEHLTHILVGRTASAGVPAVEKAVFICGEFVCLGGMSTFKNPTHWMPLPPPPETDQ